MIVPVDDFLLSEERYAVKLPNVFKSISALLSKPAAEIKFKNLTEESLTSQLEDIKTLLKTTSSVWDELSGTQLDNIFDQAVDQLSVDRNLIRQVGKPTADAISNLPKALTGRARSMGMFGAIGHTTRIVSRLIDEMLDNVHKVLNDKKSVTVNDVQVSHGLFLGMLQSVRIFAEFNGYLLASISHIATTRNSKIDIPRYMLDYITDHHEHYVGLVNQLSNAKGKYSVINEITGIRKNGLDFKMSATDQSLNRSIFKVLGVENIFLSIFGLMVRPIVLLGEVYVDMRHSYYQSIKEKKKWLEGHVALIKMELEGVDHNDPEYLKLQKMVSFYEDKIAEYDKKIQQYMD